MPDKGSFKVSLCLLISKKNDTNYVHIHCMGSKVMNLWPATLYIAQCSTPVGFSCALTCASKTFDFKQCVKAVTTFIGNFTAHLYKFWRDFKVFCIILFLLYSWHTFSSRCGTRSENEQYWNSSWVSISSCWRTSKETKKIFWHCPRKRYICILYTLTQYRQIFGINN